MIERRTSGRVPIARGALIYCGKDRGVFAAMARDVSDGGVLLQLGGLKIPRRFRLSFDNFLTVQPCRMIWNDKICVGAAFDGPLQKSTGFVPV
ncbi:MAG: PilZ domain-containing protein [Hyphomicrobium sp.]